MKSSVVIILFFLLPFCSYGQSNNISSDFGGQLIGWTNLNFSVSFHNQWGLRYIPDLSLSYPLDEEWSLDAELSANTYGSVVFPGDIYEKRADIKPYRLWLRLSANRFTLRAGLQKINFGPATLLRPLMWFDRIDPRDPLQLTDGVYGVLSRYYFQNNTNIWFWILYGNETKGWEVLPSSKKYPELGGRIQFPLPGGELGFSFHHRKTGPDSMILFDNMVEWKEMYQDRYALDGKWDVGPGIWFEYVIKHQKYNLDASPRWQQYLNLGADYTFLLGNGLHLGTEHFIMQGSEDFQFRGEAVHFTAVSTNYPVGLLDNISAMIYYNWSGESWYRFLNWQRNYDRFSLYLMAYWNPEQFAIYPNSDQLNLFSGKGFQLMVVYNH